MMSPTLIPAFSAGPPAVTPLTYAPSLTDQPYCFALDDVTFVIEIPS